MLLLDPVPEFSPEKRRAVPHVKGPAMFPDLLYLSNADIERLQISPREAREAVLAAFCDNAAGRNIGLPKSFINIGPDSWLLSMSSAAEDRGIATVKMVAIVPVEGNQARSRVNGLVCVSDYKTGLPVAVLDGNSITLIRTAATSAAAAIYLAPEAPATIGLIGCGLQALSHLDAFVDLFPSLRRVYLLSRSVRSAERIATAASEKGLAPIIVNDPDELLSESEIVVSTVPSSPGLEPFLNARSLPPSSFASAVDGGRSWRSETLTAFDRVVTDTLKQSAAPVDASERPVESVKYQDDLVHLAAGWSRPRAPSRALFGFRGFVISDLALVELAIRKARSLGIGTILPR
ncbi:MULTISPECIES: hypothetical protein [unclassified Bradyrhizobium]|uniref:hypothetical protein n=1 Tax=unclassified Bradyrhizobium TaxID=2631580 RepID=UPI001FF873AC|nr:MULTISPECIES: hypothetical protein [unclassified Bradyrhizobium]